MGVILLGAELGWGGCAAADWPRVPSGGEKFRPDRGFAERDLDPAQVRLHRAELVGQDTGAVGADLADGDHLVVANAGASIRAMRST